MATINEMRQVATQIENETQVGGNTASRVGGLFNDVVDKLEDQEATIDGNVTTIKMKRNTAAGFASANPVLAEGELGFETDRRRYKMGDGVTNWNNLPYRSEELDAEPINGSKNGVESGGVFTSSIQYKKTEIFSSLYANVYIYNNKWKHANTGYTSIYGDVTLLRGKTIIVEPLTTNGTRFALTRNAYSNNTPVQYASNQTSLISITKPYTIIVPDDATFLYCSIQLNGVDTTCKAYIVDTVKEILTTEKESNGLKIYNALMNEDVFVIDGNNIKAFELFDVDVLYKANQSSIGLSANDSSVISRSSTGKLSYKIPVDGVAYVELYTFASSSSNGQIFVDENDDVVFFCNSTSSGMIDAYVPPTAKYLIYTFDSFADAKVIIHPFIKSEKEITRTELIKKYVYAQNKLVKAGTTVINTSIGDVRMDASTGDCYIFKIPIRGAKRIHYKMYSSSSGYGSLITDISGKIIWAYDYSNGMTGATKYVEVPEGSAYLYFGTSPSLESVGYTVGIVYDAIEYDNLNRFKGVPRLFHNDSSLTTENDDSLCLAAIKFKIEDNTIPFQQGYLFHKMGMYDNKVYFGTTLDNAQEVATLDYYPRNCVIAVSPKDGTIIGVTRDVRANIRVYNGENHSIAAVSSDGNNNKPQGWLYNSGVDFVKDGNDEYCIFAEYDGSFTDGNRLYIWKGKHPYTSPSDWKTVFYKTTSYNSGHPTAGSITHWHMIRRDPWTGVLYCTSGDLTGQFMWLYSNNDGETWTEFASDYNNSTKPSWALDGQPLRCINFIFTEDYVYFATDHGSNNTLCRIKRGNNGVLDLTTREVLTGLPYGIAVNTLCYVENPNGLFMFTRIDSGFTSEYGQPVDVLFWNFGTKTLINLTQLKLNTSTWGGHRGKCYFNYTNGVVKTPAMGFADNTRCLFELIGATNNTGTIFYELI